MRGLVAVLVVGGVVALLGACGSHPKQERTAEPPATDAGAPYECMGSCYRDVIACRAAAGDAGGSVVACEQPLRKCTGACVGVDPDDDACRADAGRPWGCPCTAQQQCAPLFGQKPSCAVLNLAAALVAGDCSGIVQGTCWPGPFPAACACNLWDDWDRRPVAFRCWISDVKQQHRPPKR